MSGTGYINAFFAEYLFAGPLGSTLTPLVFLTALSAFEIAAGIALILGLLVRGFSFIFAFLLWTFVIALPVATAPGLESVEAVRSPAILAQIRDIGLSAMFFALLSMGSGALAVDRVIFGRGAAATQVTWDAQGLLLRLSAAAVFLVGGFFSGLDHIKSYSPYPILLIGIGLVIASGHFVRVAAGAAAVIIVTNMLSQLSGDATLWGNLNAVKREFAYLAACAVLLSLGGGRAAMLANVITRPLLSAILGAPRTSNAL